MNQTENKTLDTPANEISFPLREDFWAEVPNTVDDLFDES